MQQQCHYTHTGRQTRTDIETGRERGGRAGRQAAVQREREREREAQLLLAELYDDINTRDRQTDRLTLRPDSTRPDRAMQSLTNDLSLSVPLANSVNLVDSIRPSESLTLTFIDLDHHTDVT